MSTAQQFDLDALRRYAVAEWASGRADALMRDGARSKDVDRLHREALAAAQAYAAAGLVLNLDPLCPHPVVQREVYRQMEAAGIFNPLYQPKSRPKK